MKKEYYHMTNIENVKPISKIGLVPRTGKNNDSVGDEKKVVYFSENIEGAVCMYSEFESRYNMYLGKDGDNIINEYEEAKENNKSQKDIDKLYKKVLAVKRAREAKDFYDYAGGESVYFKIDGENIENEGDFSNGYTHGKIPPEKINILGIKDNESGKMNYSRDEIFKYFLSQTSKEKIFSNNVNKRIEESIPKYYERYKEEIEKYKTERFSLEEKNIKEYVLEENSKDNKINGENLFKQLEEEIHDVDEMKKAKENIEELGVKEKEEKEIKREE